MNECVNRQKYVVHTIYLHFYVIYYGLGFMSAEYLNNKFLESVIRRFQKSKQEKIKYELIIEDMATSTEKRIKNKRELSHDLAAYLLEHQQANVEFTASQHDLATAFYTLSEHLVRYAHDIIVDTDDAIQEGVMICFEKIDKFHPEKGKAFNYMTTCILNHFRQIYRTSRNYKALKEKYREFMMSKFGNIIIKNGKEIHTCDNSD